MAKYFNMLKKGCGKIEESKPKSKGGKQEKASKLMHAYSKDKKEFPGGRKQMVAVAMKESGLSKQKKGLSIKLDMNKAWSTGGARITPTKGGANTRQAVRILSQLKRTGGHKRPSASSDSQPAKDLTKVAKTPSGIGTDKDPYMKKLKSMLSVAKKSVSSFDVLQDMIKGKKEKEEKKEEMKEEKNEKEEKVEKSNNMDQVDEVIKSLLTKSNKRDTIILEKPEVKKPIKIG